MVIIPWVIVPVLSVQRIFISQRFWIEESVLTMTFFSSMRFAPSDMATVIIAGRSSGAIPTARARVKRIESMSFSPVKILKVRTPTESTIVICMRKKPKCFMPFSNAVSVTISRFFVMEPKTVSAPVATTIAFAVPLIILVHSQRQLSRFSSGVVSSTIVVFFLTG